MTAVNGNGVHAVRTVLPGVYAPIPTFFRAGSEDVDVDTFKGHIVRLARAGVGIVVCGSMGEAAHLSDDERITLVSAARSALDEAGFRHVPVIAGSGLPGTRGTIALTRSLAAAGADAVLVLNAGYFAGALSADREAVIQHFSDVADASPVPVFIYNYPGATGGLDFDSELLLELATHPNIRGVKLTCGDVGKLTRVALSAPPEEFLVLGGYADFLLPGLAARGAGAITGLANLAPYALVRADQLGRAALHHPDDLPEAQRLQQVLALADRTIARAGVPGTKALLERAAGYGGPPRRPLRPSAPKAVEALWEHPHVVALRELEAECALKAKQGGVVNGNAVVNGH